jgi:alginate export protein
MRTVFAWTIAIAAATNIARAQTDPAVASADPVRAYSLLREDEDWSFLKDPGLSNDPWDRVKYIPLGSDGWFLTIGGEVREALEQVGSDNWGKQGYTNTFFLERYMLHSDWHLGRSFRVFVQLKSGLESFRQGGPRPIDEKKLDFEAAFVEIGAAQGDRWVVLQAGRQELNYGSGRLVSVREGPNVRQSFDGAKLKGRAGAWRLDAFAARPDVDKTGFFNNVPDHHTSFWGVYATRPLRHRMAVDTYYLGLDRKSATFDRGTAPEVRHSLGVRLWRPTATKEHDWDFDYEGVWQFGSFGAAAIRAWTFASDTGYSFPAAPLHPRFSVKADISSGDDPRANSLGTFNPIFPIGNYFGVLADTGPGPVNFIDVHPRLQTRLPRNVSVSTDLVAQWRESLYDGVYAVPGFLLVPAGNSRARFVGYRPGMEVRWQIDRHAYLQADYGVFFAGEFLKQASPGRNINYTELWAGYKF